MSLRLSTVTVISLAALLCAPASAQEIKPGLYTTTSKIGGNNQVTDLLKQQKEAMAGMTPAQRQQMADMPKMMGQMMEGMTPEQRKKMQAMMGDKAGAMEAMQSMQLQQNADGSTSMKMCVTKEMAEQRMLVTQHGRCKHENGKMSGGVMKINYTCSQPPSKGEGELRVTGPNSFSTKMKMVSTEPGNKQTMEVDSTATWLGADCGNVKPIDAKAFKQ
jgi:hypothetical protein